MKKVKYLSFGKWLNKARGSYSLQYVGNLIGKSHSSVSEYEKGYVRPPKLIVAYLINYYNANPLKIAGFLFYDPNEIQFLSRNLKFSGQSANEFKEECWNKLNYTRKYRETGNPHDA